MRTNGPTVAANSIHSNISALDSAIGPDSDLTVVTRTTGQLVANTSILKKIDELDAAIGFDAQMSGSPPILSKSATVYQNLDRLETAALARRVQTIKLTIGGVGVANCDYNFLGPEDQVEQVITLGVIPAYARIIDVITVTDAVFTGAVTLVAETGTTSSGNDIITSASIYATGAITAAAVGGSPYNTPSGTSSSVYVAATPGANWNLVTAGKVSVYITYINTLNNVLA